MRLHAAIRQRCAFLDLQHRRRLLLFVLKTFELRSPSVALVVQQLCCVQQVALSSPVVQPGNAENLVLPSISAPRFERALRQLPALIGKVTIHHRNDARIAGSFVILGENLQHHHSRPPVVVSLGANHPGCSRIVQSPVNVLLRFGFESGVIEQVGERNEAIQKIRSSLPGFARAAEPATVRADVRPRFIQVSPKAVCLDLQLPPKPSGRTNLPKRQKIEGIRAKRRAVLDDVCASRHGIGRWSRSRRAKGPQSFAGDGREAESSELREKSAAIQCIAHARPLLGKPTAMWNYSGDSPTVL